MHDILMHQKKSKLEQFIWTNIKKMLVHFFLSKLKAIDYY